MVGGRALAALALATVATLAGCGALVPGGVSDGASDDSAGTLTPVPIPTESRTATPRPSVTGVDRLSDSDAFAAAHRQALANASYTVTLNTTVFADDGQLATVEQQVRVANDGDPYRFERSLERAPSAQAAIGGDGFVLWVADGSGWLRRSGPDGPVYGRFTSVYPRTALAEPSHHGRLARLLGGFRMGVVNRAGVGDGFRYRYRSVETINASRIETPSGVYDPHDARLSLLVTPGGVVREYRLTYGATAGGRPVRVTETFAVSGIGETSVSEPSWVRSARRATEDGSRTALVGARVPWPDSDPADSQTEPAKSGTATDPTNS